MTTPTRRLAMQSGRMLWLPELNPINLDKGDLRVSARYCGRDLIADIVGIWHCTVPLGAGTGGMEQPASVAMLRSIERRPTALPGGGWELFSTDFVSTARSAFFTKYECLSFSPAHEAQSGTARSAPCCNRFHGSAVLPLLESRPRPQSDLRIH